MGIESIAKIGSNVFVKNVVKEIGNVNKLKDLSKTVFKEAALIQPKSPVRTALSGADQVLRNLGAKVEMEVPVDTFLRNVPAKQRKTAASLLGNPETVHFKAKHNNKGGFSILGFQAKKGDKVVGNGALSITNFGEKDAVAKWRISGGKKGKNLIGNGFVDCAQTATQEQVSVVPSYINRMLRMDAKAGNAAASHLQVNGSKLLQLLPDCNLGNIANIQPKVVDINISKFMDVIRKNIGNLTT